LLDIDHDITQLERDNAEALIHRELNTADRAAPHQSLPPQEDANFSDLMLAEIERVGTNKKRKGGIDESRYDSVLEPPAGTDAKSWRDALRTAYASSTYLSSRQINLRLLEESGKNAWLISNSQLDQLLKAQERELESVNEEIDAVNRERKTTQEASKGELATLEEAWKEGLRRLVNVQLATTELRHEIQSRAVE
jgi:pre-mRNA-splicing factor SPF27